MKQTEFFQNRSPLSTLSRKLCNTGIRKVHRTQLFPALAYRTIQILLYFLNIQQKIHRNMF